MKLRTLTFLILFSLVVVCPGWIPTPVLGAETPALVIPHDTAQAVELAKTWLASSLDNGFQSIPYVGEKRPQVSSARPCKDLQNSFVVEVTTTPHVHPMISGSANRKGIIYRLLVSKKTGRIAIDEMVIDEPLISQYASFARCAAPLLSLLNHAFVPGFKNGPEDFNSRAFGQSYHCLFPFFGKRILGCLPVQPRRDKLPAWAQKDATQLENGLRVYMFPDAFPARFWAENALKAQAAGDGDLLAAVSLYPQFAKSLGVNPNEKVQPIKLEGWAKHGMLFAQDTRERLAAELLAQKGDSVGLKTAIFRFGSTDVFLIGKGNAEDTFFSTFDAGSIHSEIKYGRHVAGKQVSSGKKLPSLAQLISEGDFFALSVARKHLPLRTLLQKAADMKDPYAIRASAIIAEF